MSHRVDRVARGPVSAPVPKVPRVQRRAEDEEERDEAPDRRPAPRARPEPDDGRPHVDVLA